MKKIISVALAGAVMLSAIPAMADDINITIDGEEFVPRNALGEIVEPFIENGSTFLPVRAMGEAVGKTVKFDAENYAVYIGEEPSEEDKEREPVLLIEDTVIYADEVEDSSMVYDLVNMEKVVKLAESKFPGEEILAYYNEIIEWVDERALAGYESYYYYCACSIMLNLGAPEGCADREKYVTAQHILVKDEETALKVIDALNDGAAFEDMIDEYNLDPGQERGSSYTFTYGEMVEEFEKAAFALEVDKYTKEPVATAYGYHIILRLPLDEFAADSAYYQTYILPAEIENTECKVVKIGEAGDYGKINSVVYTGDMLKKVYELFMGESSSFMPSDAFYYAGTMTMVNNLAREKGIVEEEYAEEFDLDYEMGLFMQLYEAMFDGTVTFSELEVVSCYETMEIEVFKKMKVFVDGKLIVPCDVNNSYVEPKNIDGTVYVPVRAIVEALSMNADWDNDTRTVVITK